MGVTGTIRRELARRAPKLDDRLHETTWRRRNRDRAFDAQPPAQLRGVVDRLRADGVVITDVDTVFGDRAPYDAAAARAKELYERPREERAAEAGSKATFLTKLIEGPLDFDDPFVRLVLHPNALAVANAYMRMRSTLRAVDLWLTHPTPGDAVQTQLWHRDADDVMNVKMFVYFTDVRREAGPLCYAPDTHPLGSRRHLPEHDEQGRSNDAQLERVAPRSDWVLCEGKPGTVVFADTCGYHKQLKPESDERLLLVSHYVSGTPFVPPTLELRGADESSLTDDQYVAVFDRAR
jgi:Phytanoyl-CoA dioxygenase (PhyH)